MQVYNLANALGNGIRTKRYNITFSDLTTAGTTQSINVLLLPYGSVIMGVRQKHDVAFSGGGITAMTTELFSSTTTNITSAFNVFQSVSNTALQMTTLFFADTYIANQLYVTFTSTTANVNTATAGSVSIDITYLDVTTANLTGTPYNQPELYPA